MESSNLFLLMLTLGAVAFYIGRSRSLLVAKPLGGIRHLHSLPNYYGLNALLWCALPSLIILVLWLIFDEPVINSIVMGSLPADIAPASLADYNLLLNKISNLADGIMSTKGKSASLVAVADSMAGLRVISQWVLTALCLILATVGL